VQALLLARHWAAAGHDVVVAGHDNRPTTEGRLSVLRLPVWRRSRATRAASYLASALWLLWRARHRTDLVYCRFLKEQAFAASLARCLALIRHPVVACPASTSTSGEAAYIARSRFRRVWLGVFRRGHTVVNAMSWRIEDEMRQVGLEHACISRIPNGVAIPSASGLCARREPGPVRILFVGRLVTEKGLDTLLAAAQLLIEAGRVFELRLVGDGPLRQEIQDQIRALSLDARVTLVGRLPPDAVTRQFATADLFVLPSRLEGMPGALLEAMAHGVPAVATRVSGSEDVLDGTTGWLVPVEDWQALADALRQAIDLGRDGLGRMGIAARQKAARDYDIERVAALYLDLFGELIEQAHPSGNSPSAVPSGRPSNDSASYKR
jgi:glycosyltransferase involved in cell wall biosynthesis